MTHGFSPARALEEPEYLLRTYRERRADYPKERFDGPWPANLIPIGNDGSGGDYAIEAGVGSGPPVIFLDHDSGDIVQQAISLQNFVNRERADLAIQIYNALTATPPAERTRLVLPLATEGRPRAKR